MNISQEMLSTRKSGIVYCECGTVHLVDINPAIDVVVAQCDCERRVTWVRPGVPVLEILQDIVTSIEKQVTL